MNEKAAMVLGAILTTAVCFGINWVLWDIYTWIIAQGEKRRQGK